MRTFWSASQFQNSDLIRESKTLESTIAEKVKEKQVCLWTGLISPQMWGLGPAPIYLHMLVHFLKTMVTLLHFKIAKKSPLATHH